MRTFPSLLRRLQLSLSLSLATLPAGAHAQLILNGGTTIVPAAAPTTTNNALGHYGFHSNSDLFHQLTWNQGLMLLNGHPNFFNQVLLTNGPSNRGLHFLNDAEFIASGAVNQVDNYQNLFIGTLTPDLSGSWGFRIRNEDDRAAIWIDLNQDGILTANPFALGNGLGEMLSWDGDRTNRTVNLTVGQTYFVVFGHTEFGGGSVVEIGFTRPGDPEMVIRPADPAQAGLWSFSNLTPTVGSAIQVQASSTLQLDGMVQSPSLTFQNPGLTLTTSSTLGAQGIQSGSLTVTGTTTLEGNSTFNLTNANVLLNGVVQNGSIASGITKTGAGHLALGAANTYTGDTIISGGVIRLGNNAALGNETGKTVINGGTLDIAGFRAGANGNELVEVQGVGANGAGAIINTGNQQTSAFRRITLTGDATFRADTRWDMRNTGGAATFDMGGHTLTKVGTGQLSLVSTAVVNPGSVNIQQGIFEIEAGTSFGGTGTISAASGTTLQFWNNPNTHSVNTSLANNANLRSHGGGGPTLTGNMALTGGIANIQTVNPMTLTGNISGIGGFTKTEASSLTLSGNSSFSGNVTISAGTLNVRSNNALGSAAGNTTVMAGATADLANNITTPESFFLAGTGTTGQGALHNSSGNNTVTGTISTQMLNFTVGSSSGSLNLDGTVDLGYANMEVSGAGNVTINGTIGGAATAASAAGGVAPGGLMGKFIQLNDGTALIGNRTSNSNNLYLPLNGTGDITLQQLGLTPTSTASGLTINYPSTNSQPFGPGSTIGTDNIGAIFTGTINITTGGTYTFNTTSDDGSVFFLDGTRIVNNNQNQGMTLRNGTIDLDPGSYNYTIGYFEGAGGAGLIASYSGPDTGGATTILTNANGSFFDTTNPGANGGFNIGATPYLLFEVPAGANTPLETLRVADARLVQRIDFGTGTETLPGDGSVLDRGGTSGNPYGGIGVNIGVDQIAAVFEGHLIVPEDANYRFTARSDDNHQLYIDLDGNGTFTPLSELLLDRGTTGGGGMANFTTPDVFLAAGDYAIKVLTSEGGGGAGMQLSWQQMDGANPFARQIIGPNNLGLQGVSNDITKTGSGILTLTGANTYAGTTTVAEGTLLVNNTSGSGTGLSDVHVLSGATLGGTGFIGTLAAPTSVTIHSGGILAPGNSPGTLTLLGTTLLSPGSIFSVDILNPTTDLLVIGSGTIDLTDAILAGTWGGSSANVFSGTYDASSMHWLIDNQGADPITGTFANSTLAPSFAGLFGGVDPHLVSVGGQLFAAFYNSQFGNFSQAGLTGGNDFLLIAIPEPSRPLLLTIALTPLLLRRRRR
jgi:fibronectin-binding autotransporter adhesin